MHELRRKCIRATYGQTFYLLEKNLGVKILHRHLPLEKKDRKIPIVVERYRKYRRGMARLFSTVYAISDSVRS